MFATPVTYTYEDDQGKEQTVTEKFWFNISKREMLKMNRQFEGGIENFIDAFAKEQDPDKMYEFFEQIILFSHGERVDGGKGFDKSQAVQKKFMASLAFNELFEDLCMREGSDKRLARFMEGVFPPEMVKITTEKFEKALEETGGDVEKAIAKVEAELKPSGDGTDVPTTTDT